MGRAYPDLAAFMDGVPVLATPQKGLQLRLPALLSYSYSWLSVEHHRLERLTNHSGFAQLCYGGVVHPSICGGTSASTPTVAGPLHCVPAITSAVVSATASAIVSAIVSARVVVKLPPQPFQQRQ